ncbi:hypothetical protein N2152v2_005197 [Parachlorella kessleri]
MQLADLENDYLNPHDAAASINKLVMPEYAMQGAVTVLMLVSGNWVLGVVHTCLLAFHLRQISYRRHLTDVTEIFREVKLRKKQALAKLVLYLGAFVWTIYRLVEVIIVGLITPKGRAAAKDVLRQAAAALNR